jgi:hypothetical protein
MKGSMLRILITALAIALMFSTAHAQIQKRGGMRFWNLTLYTLTSLQFSPLGKNNWGVNQCENDDDKAVDHDERLRITGLSPGRYDAKLTDKTGRTCLVKEVEVTGGVFAIEEKQLTDCSPK